MKSNFFAWITQFLVWFITAPIYRFFFKVRVDGKENLLVSNDDNAPNHKSSGNGCNYDTQKLYNRGLHGPLVVIANHISWHDPFFIRDILGMASPMLPLKFMATKNFHNPFMNFLYRIKIVPFIYFLFGALVIVEGRGLAVNLRNAKMVLKNRGVVVMYPEGQINQAPNHGGDLLKFKRGAAALAIDEGVPVLPIYLKSVYNHKEGIQEMSANIGKVFRLPKSMSYEEGARRMRGVVGGLEAD